jgi:hypothetical protein
MPFAFEDRLLRPQMADNSAYFMRRESDICRNRKIVEPELGFMISESNVNVRRLRSLIRVEKGPIWTPT